MDPVSAQTTGTNQTQYVGLLLLLFLLLLLLDALEMMTFSVATTQTANLCGVPGSAMERLTAQIKRMKTTARIAQISMGLVSEEKYVGHFDLFHANHMLTKKRTVS